LHHAQLSPLDTQGDSPVTRLLALVWPALRASDAEAPRFDAMLDRLDDLSPRIEAVDRGVALLDITGLGPLLGEERRIAARAVALARGIAPLPLKAGVGDNRWLAVLAARLARSTTPDAQAAFRAFPAGAAAARHSLAPLPLDLLPADPATRARFALFGLTAMGQLATLPRSAVGAQFGPPGERLQALARGHDPRPLVPRRRPERVEATAVFEPPAEGITEIALALRRLAAELCETLRSRHLAPGRATLDLRMEDAPRLRIELAFPEPALEPDWIARLLIGRLEQATRARQATEEEPRIVAIGLAFDRLADPAARQLPAFEVRVGRWEELRWSLERLTMRFGEGRLWRASHDRPSASLPEHRSSLVKL
jgi:nucleotidyltransferase/DNA polymerase involved in DNA repair